MRGRIGAHKLHATHDPLEITAVARATFWRSFLDQVDPELPEPERLRRAEHLRKAHYAQLALASARKRAKKQKQTAEPENSAAARMTLTEVMSDATGQQHPSA